MAETNPLAPPQIKRKSGSGFYQEGDRCIAIDYAAGGVQRVCTVGLTGTDSTGKKYLTMRYGDDPFIEAFICNREDIVEELPDDNIEAIEAWLDKEN